MKKNGIKITAFVFLALYFIIFESYRVYAEDYGVARIYGQDRFSTNIKISDYGWKSGSSYAIMVSGNDFPDALCAAPLSHKLDAPILLTRGSQLSTELKNKIISLNVKNVFIVGGTGVVSQSIQDSLARLNIKCVRLAGVNRYETSVKVAKYLNSDKFIVATGENFPDALSIASYAASSNTPILLTYSNALPDSVYSYLHSMNGAKVYVIGGEGAVSKNAASRLGSFERISGSSRYETNYQVIKKFYAQGFTKIYMTTGGNFPDALSVSSIAAKNNSPILLIDDRMSSNQIRLVREKRDNITERVVIGGEAVTPNYVADRMFVNSSSITPQDFINEYKSGLSADELKAYDTLGLGNYLYPNSTDISGLFNTKSSELLSKGKYIQNQSNFDGAMNIYNALLKYNINVSIRTQAVIYNNSAQDHNRIISSYSYKTSYQNAVISGLNYYESHKVSYLNNISYTAMGDFLNFSQTRSFVPSSTLKFDSNGIPMVKYGDQFYYNPVTVSQYGLHLHSMFVKGDGTQLKNIIKCADFIVSYMSDDGSLRYNFSHVQYNTLNSGWTSSMAQGEALSLLSRAYKLTGNIEYIKSGIKIFNYLTTPVKDGGVMDTLEALDPALKDHIFFQEYVTDKPSYTLNGYIYTLLGIYDWSQLGKEVNLIDGTSADYYFNEGIKSLKIVLPYYDIGGYTSYDLHYITAGTNPTHANYYHGIHIELLQALYSITKDSSFQNIRTQWVNYVK